MTDKGLQDADTICPYSRGVMTNPLRHTKCGHRIDQGSLANVMSRSNGYRCPIPGCTSLWNAKTSFVEDHEFKYKMDRFQRQRQSQVQTQAASGAWGSTDVIGEDWGTQL